MLLEQSNVNALAGKVRASFVCLILTHLFFSSAAPRTAHQAQTKAEVAAFAGQTVTSPQSCLSKIDQLAERIYREARDSGREVDVKELGQKKSEIANNCLAAFSINSVALESLPDLAKLYFQAHRQSQADKAIGRY